MIRTRVAWIIADFRILFDLILVVYYIRKILFSLDNGASSINSNLFGEACDRPAPCWRVPPGHSACQAYSLGVLDCLGSLVQVRCPRTVHVDSNIYPSHLYGPTDPKSLTHVSSSTRDEFYFAETRRSF